MKSKAKTRKAAAKRVRTTKGGKKGGKMMVQKSCQNHLLSNKSKKAKRDEYSDAPAHRKKQLKRLLPNG